MTRGSDWSDVVTFTGLGDLAGASAIIMTIKDVASDPDAEARVMLGLSDGVTVTSATTARFEIDGAEITSALPRGHYVYEVRVEFGAVTARTAHGSVRVAAGGVNG